MASVIMDGNFSAQHQQTKRPGDDVRLADGHGFMVTDAPYKKHLRTAVQIKQVCYLLESKSRAVLTRPAQKLTCHDHKAVLAASTERAALEATGIGAVACSRHGFFFPHSVVDFQKGEQ